MPTFLLLSASTPIGQRPVLQASRTNDDWSFLRDSKKKKANADLWDWLKYIPLHIGREGFLSIGGEARETYEFYRNAGFGSGVQNDNGYLLERYRLSFDLHLSSARMFVELNRSSEEGRRGGARPSDENRTDFYQAFAEIGPGARFGRQELALGSGRLFALKEGSNVPLSFEGLRLGSKVQNWRVDAFAFRPVTTSFGAFDDKPSNSQRVWGTYATVGKKDAFDVYYIGRDRDAAKFAQGTAHEIRHSFGIRSSGHWGPLTRDYEVIYQTGSFGGAQINAYRLAFDTYFDFPGPNNWRFGLRLDEGSGDGNAKDNRLHTYDGLFQSGSYSGKPGLLGPANELDVEPSVSFVPRKNWSASAAIGFLWRASDSDATYLINGNPDRTKPGDNAKYVGSRTTLGLSWQKDSHQSYSMNYIYVSPGKYYQQTGASGNESYFAFWTTYRF